MRPTQAGPASSTGKYKSTTDPGKSLPSGGGNDGFRRAGTASGPTSSSGQYTATLDPGKSLPSGTSNAGAFCSSCGKQNSVGGKFCPNCGGPM